LLRLIEARNSFETYGFIDVYDANISLQKRVDELESMCKEYERQMLQLKGGAADGESRKSSSKKEAELRDRIEKLQDQLNERQKAELENSKKHTKISTELSELKELSSSNDLIMKQLRLEHAQANETIENLLSRIKESESSAFLLEQQNSDLKDAILKLQDDSSNLEKLNNELLGRFVNEKEKQMEEFNKMNIMLEHQQKEIDMLRSLRRQADEQVSRLENTSSIPKGDTDAVGNTDGKWEKKWDSVSVSVPSKPKFTIKAHLSDGICVRYDGSVGNFVVTAGSDGVIHVWDTCTGQLNATLRANSAQPVLGVDMNGGLVAGCSCDKMCRIWNLKSKRMIHQLVGHGSKVTSVRLSSDAKSVLTGSVDRTLKLWDVSRNTYKQLLTLNHDSAVYGVDMTSDSFTAVSGHLDGGLRCWDTRSGKRTLEISSIHTDCVTSVQFDPSNFTQILSCSRDSTLKIVDVRKNDVVKVFGHPKTTPSVVSLLSPTASFSPNGKYVAAGSGSTGKVFIWETHAYSNNAPLKELKSHECGVEAVAWGRGGRSGQQVATIDKAGNLILWI